MRLRNIHDFLHCGHGAFGLVLLTTYHGAFEAGEEKWTCDIHVSASAAWLMQGVKLGLFNETLEE